MTKAKDSRKMSTKRYVIVGNEKFGLYYGWTEQSQADMDAQVARDHTVRLNDCRHVCRYYSKTGGITSLALHGPCGPNVKDCRIGAPAPSSLLSGVVNVYDCSADAVAAFARIEARDA